MQVRGPDEAHLREQDPVSGKRDRRHRSGTLTASSSTRHVILNFAGKATALGVGTGTWTLGKVKAYTGIKLAKRGKY